jgi:glycosyltransferase involved in cell wall biosynthesis
MGKAAVYVNPFQPEAIAEGLLRALKDQALRASLKREGPRRARLFSWQRCAEATVQTYRRALGA